jgi:hypothetical protein
MALHRLTQVTVGVPNVDETAQYYAEFGLTPDSSSTVATRRFTTPAGGLSRSASAPTTPTTWAASRLG